MNTRAEGTYFQTSNLVLQKKVTGADDTRHALQEIGGLADCWDLDDGDIVYHPALVVHHLEAFDTAEMNWREKNHLLRSRSGQH